MGELLPIDQRMDAYLAVIADHPKLTIPERTRLFFLALSPPEPEIDYDHMMRCQDRWCEECKPT